MTGSVGISLMLWVIGGLLTLCGISVFLEFGLAIPRSGGEKNYLERVYRESPQIQCLPMRRT
jgi:amino acid transporter